MCRAKQNIYTRYLHQESLGMLLACLHTCEQTFKYLVRLSTGGIMNNYTSTKKITLDQPIIFDQTMYRYKCKFLEYQLRISKASSMMWSIFTLVIIVKVVKFLYS